jgi:hypothetical protein
MLAAILWAAPTQATPVFTLLPGTGSTVASPGDTVGWGYEITNDDTTDWLVISSFNANLFQFGTLTDILDYPILAPGATVTNSYLPGLQGLAEFTWDATAPPGFTNSGVFTIGAEIWDGDPLLGGVFVSALPDFTSSYAISTTATPVPEPASVLLFGAGLAVVVARRRKSRERERRFSLAVPRRDTRG